jgi:predicted phosphodiesterase
MSELSDKFLALVSPGPSGSDMKAVNAPESWRPRMEVDESGGYVISTPRKAGEVPDQKAILEDFDLDPDSWEVTSLRKSRWQNHAGEWLEAYRLSLRPSLLFSTRDFDVEKLVTEVAKWKPGKPEKITSGELAFIFCPSDQQIGKKQGDQGTETTVARLLDMTNQGVQRLKDLRKMGRSIGTVVIPLPGDHVEGNTSQNGKLQGLASSDLGLTEQTRVARRILMAQIKAFAPMADRIIVPVVNGNHDEVTRQVIADPSDGWNVEIASAVQDACAENPALSHVEFRYPDKSHQTLSIDICGTMLGLFHGHQTGNNVLKYLQEQAAGQTALGMCDVWISGHFHSFKAMDVGMRFWVQAPTTDPGSAWFRDRHGLESLPGVLTMVIGEGHNPRQDISVISGIRDN